MTALLLQVTAIMLLRHRLGRRWLRRPMTLLVLTSAVYQGVSSLLLALPFVHAWDVYRIGVRQSYVDSATLIMSAAMLAFTVTYLLTCPERPVTTVSPDDIRRTASTLDWRWLVCACAPLAVLTYEGRGYNSVLTTGLPGTSLSTNLASTFFIVLVVLTAFSFLLRHGVRWFVPVMLVQSLLLAAAGERTPVIVDAITLILLLAHAGLRPQRRQLLAAGAVTVIAALAITGVRAEQGRALYYRNSGLSARVTALGGGLSAATKTPAGQNGPGLVAQAAIRLDGVDFAGAILQSVSLGQSRLSAAYVPESLLLAVPSAAWPSKLEHGNGLNPTLLELDDFGLQQINFLPTLPGLYTGFLSPPWLVLFLASLGVAFGLAERVLFRRFTSARLILLAATVLAAFTYEAGLPEMLIALRAGVAMAVVVKIIEAMRVRNARRRRLAVSGSLTGLLGQPRTAHE